MNGAHFEAVKARLESSPGLAGRVFDAARVDASGLIRDNYVILDLMCIGLDDRRLTADQQADSDCDVDVSVTVVGTDAENVRTVTDRVSAMVLGHRFVVDGRRCSKPVAEFAQVEPDLSVTPPLFYAEHGFTFRSLRA